MRKDKILVIGDLMLDRYFYTENKRLNPEAPALLLDVTKTEYYLGGAGNVAKTIKQLGGDVYLFGIVGQDTYTETIMDLINFPAWILSIDKVPNIVKSRIITDNRYVLRFDEEVIYGNDVITEINKQAEVLLRTKEFDLIVVSDYGKGSITNGILKILKNIKTPIILDPAECNAEFYPNVDIVRCNQKEFEKFAYKIPHKNIIITKGKGGAVLKIKDKEILFPIKEKINVRDVTGAGDVFVASLAVFYKKGLIKACKIANQLASKSTENFGTGGLKNG